MGDWRIHNARVLDPKRGLVAGAVRVSEGRIAQLDPPEAPANAATDGAARTIDAGGRLLTPGLIDLHIHGIEHHLFEASPDDLVAGLAALARYGVTTVLPTLYRSMDRAHLPALRDLVAALADIQTIDVPGFHLEGPFLKLAGAGAATMAGDPELLESLLDTTDGRAAAMSISPDTADIVPVVRRLSECGIASFITHTQASVEQTVAAIEAGARHGTHFYDVFPAPPETDPGVRPVGAVETLLADPRVSVDFIPDGVHVHPMAIRAALAAKGSDKVIAITDANLGAGLEPGVYDTPWGFPVRIELGKATRIHEPGTERDGMLAGSSLTLPAAIANLRRWLDLPEHEVWAMATANPAAVMGWTTKGRIEPGFDADLVLWDEDADGLLTAVGVWSRGRLVHHTDAALEPRS